MFERESERILRELASRGDPGLTAIDWQILEGLAASQPDATTAEVVDRAESTVRRRISDLERLLADDLGVPPKRGHLVSWYHLHVSGKWRRWAEK